MKIDIDHIAYLARLGLTDAEKKTLGGQLEDILNYAENLKKLDTKDVPATSHAIPMKNVFRDDLVEKYADTGPIINNGPDVEDNMFKVPKIME
jgi:aspartyl-tRNA(Asn)/glutamyl-tRNA(Gln) amidotransferase subunit C